MNQIRPKPRLNSPYMAADFFCGKGRIYLGGTPFYIRAICGPGLVLFLRFHRIGFYGIQYIRQFFRPDASASVCQFSAGLFIQYFHLLTEDDVENGAKFDDIIARSRTGDKLHGRDGWTRAPFEIPYRCLVPKKLDGILVAGRCISQTHGAVRRWSPRDILTCMATGTAAGTAAAFAAKNKVAVRNVDVKEVQNGLNLSL